MANYCCTIRTNYFHVKDETYFLDLMDNSYGCEDAIEVFRSEDENGDQVFGFGLYGCIAGFMPSRTDEVMEPDYDAFIHHLQKCVADDDAIIILESGNEKMRYVVGSATVITSSKCEYINMQELAIDKAIEMLNDPKWQTKCEY